MDVAAKLQLRPGQTLFVGGRPAGLGAELPGGVDDAESADALIVFCNDSTALGPWRRQLLSAASRDAMVWVAYPKAGQLGTDLNRDRLWQLLAADSLRPVRQIALDDVWSALRFKRS
jgi:hypothetical protein